MRSGPAEADVRVRVAQHVEAFGVVEHAWVAVGDAVQQHDLVALRELVVADTVVAFVAVRRMNVTGDATRTISSTAVGVTPSRSSCHTRRWSGFCDSRCMPRLIAVRVVSLPGDREQDEERRDLVRRQHVLVALGVHERGGEVVARVLCGARSASSFISVVSCMPASNIAVIGSRPPSMSGSPAPRMTFVASSTVRNSLRGMPIMSQMTSSGNGCESAVDEVDLALLAHAVDHLGADRLDRIEHRRELPRRERARHDAALARVARVVHVDERPEELQGLGRHVGDRHRARVRSRSLRAAG